MEQKNASGALEDAEKGLAIDSTCKELLEIRDRATKDLEKGRMKRLVIEEVSDSDSEEEQGVEAIEMEAKPPMPARPQAGRDFLASPEWGGPLPGYYFGTGDKGAGYYPDPKASAELPEPQGEKAAPAGRTRIAVVEDDSDEEESEAAETANKATADEEGKEVEEEVWDSLPPLPSLLDPMSSPSMGFTHSSLAIEDPA